MASNTWVNSTIPKANIKCVLNASAIATTYSTSGTMFPIGASIGNASSTTVELSNMRGATINADTFVVEYVK